MGSRARAPSARAAESAAHRPPPVGLRIAVAQRGAQPRAGHVRSPGPQRGSAKVGLQFCRWEVGGTKHPDGLANDWRAVEGGGGVERKTPGLNRGIKKGGRKGKPRLWSWACWKGAFACGAQGTESPR